MDIIYFLGLRNDLIGSYDQGRGLVQRTVGVHSLKNEEWAVVGSEGLFTTSTLELDLHGERIPEIFVAVARN